LRSTRFDRVRCGCDVGGDRPKQAVELTLKRKDLRLAGQGCCRIYPSRRRRPNPQVKYPGKRLRTRPSIPNQRPLYVSALVSRTHAASGLDRPVINRLGPRNSTTTGPVVSGASIWVQIVLIGARRATFRKPPASDLNLSTSVSIKAQLEAPARDISARSVEKR
jgi:hypothetical protein